MRKIISILLFFVLVNSQSIGQSLKAWVEAGDTAMVNGDYYTAMKYYEIALEYDSTSLSNKYKYGDAAWNFKAFDLAETVIDEVIQLDTNQQFPLARIRKAQIAITKSNYQQGLYWINDFNQLKSSEKEKYQELSNLLKEQCYWAESNKDTTRRVALKIFPEGINSPESEFGLTLNRDKLYFASFKEELAKDKHFPERKGAKIFELPIGTLDLKSMDVLNDSTRIIGNLTFAKNNSLVYYSGCKYDDDNEITCEIFFRAIGPDGSFGPEDTLNINLEGYSTTQPAAGFHQKEEKDILYFSSNRPFGGRNQGYDIYAAEILANGEVSKPINLRQINTLGNEITPFFNEKAQSLFFSSNFQIASLGGYDIYQSSVFDSPYVPTQIKNGGVAFNSSYDDQYFIIDDVGNKAFFTSNRPGTQVVDVFSKACCNDIFTAELSPTIELVVEVYEGTPELRKPVTDALVLLLELEGNEMPTGNIPPIVNDNRYDFLLSQFGYFRLEVNKSTFIPYSQVIDLRNQIIIKDSTLTYEVYLKKSLIDLEVLTFDCKTEEPLKEVQIELNEFKGGVKRQVFPTAIKNEQQEFLFKSIPLNSEIKLKAQRVGYQPAEIEKTFTVADVIEFGNQITFEICLHPDPIPPLPFSLYYNNDEPGPKTLTSISSSTYSEASKDYYQQKDLFVQKFIEGMAPEDTLVSATRLRNFFDRDVLGGQITLKLFLEKLVPFLEEGNELEIELQGYTSPRGDEEYNQKLAERRINSLVKEFEAYKNGAIKPYLEKGTFKIKILPIGEDPGIDPEIKSKLEDMSDLRNSVYSFSASFSRRADIIGINVKLVDEE
jgi:hypothetical protein